MDDAPLAPSDDVATSLTVPSSSAAVAVDDGPGAARCPFPHGATAAPVRDTADDAKCPFPHQLLASGAPRVGERSPADVFVRRLLRIREQPSGASAASAYSSFQRSMLISAIRCTLTYVVFPFVMPAVGFATGVGPVIGLVIGLVAITCDVFTIRRFFSVDHKWRWHFSAIAVAVICLLSVLMVQDVVHLVT